MISNHVMKPLRLFVSAMFFLTSLVRAEVLRLYLEQAGVRASNLSVRGYGESQPVASNDTAAGRAQNRRVALEMRDR